MMLRPSPILLFSSLITRAVPFRVAPSSNVLLSLATERQYRNRYSTIAISAHQAVSRHRTLLQATLAPRENQEVNNPKDLLTCQLCKRSFGSRNAIFRHLRGEDADDSDCYMKAAQLGMEGTKASRGKEILLTTVIRYGYVVNNMEAVSSQTNDSREIQYKVGLNDIVANTIHDAFVNLTTAFFEREDLDSIEFSTSALSWSTAAKLRQPSLRQDAEVLGASAEVLSFNYKLVVPPTNNKWNEYVKSNRLFDDMQSNVDARIDSNDLQIRLHAIDALTPRSTKFYAERGCSQRSYRFLLPIRWLNFQCGDRGETKRLLEWIETVTATSLSERKHQPRGDTTMTPPDCIMRLKRALKSAESKTVPNRRTRRQSSSKVASKTTTGDEDESGSTLDNSSDFLVTNGGPVRLSQGRFGQLWRKERRCWSNFCHPELRGMASSPSHDATWRALDKATIIDVVNLSQKVVEERTEEDELHNIHVVLEFRGDGFLLGVLPRLISTIVGMANEWIPNNFFEVATRPDVYILTPPMCPFTHGMLYFHGPRYHFHEITAKDSNDSLGDGKGMNQMFHNCISARSSEYDWEKTIRNLLSFHSSIARADEDDWLLSLRDDISISIKQDMNMQVKNTAGLHIGQSGADREVNSTPELTTGCPDGAYSKTLELLRHAVKDQQWPSTSMARSRVIAGSSSKGKTDSMFTTKKASVTSSFPGNTQSSGSFTVVNMDLWKRDSDVPLPAANLRLPELAKSVFDLEKEIIESTRSIPSADGMTKDTESFVLRPPSTHCAVNRNAQFTPHVDSGRGLGQSLSMIVGLGDYSGGEVMVEGKPYGIRYNPLEFDGWKQLHWTSPFVGERYSLVWFSPELSDSREEEHDHAYRLAEMHNSKTILLLPPLTYRDNSTDCLVIREILDPQKNIYTQESNGFSVKGHVVLDIGAHIGVFSRYAISEGCTRIISYEPEPSNFDLLSQNLLAANNDLSIELHSKAVGNKSETRTLVIARDENDGKQNTWRHSFSEYSQYVDKSTKLPSEAQKGILDRVEVQSVSFFGGALVPDVTFVKLDCEGAEMEILLSPNASDIASWLDVTHLVFEWSFTKERRVSLFHQMLSNLQNAGFSVYYEGMGSWWDKDPNVLWPYPQDLLVFARK